MKRLIDSSTITKLKVDLFETKEGQFWPTPTVVIVIAAIGVFAAILQFRSSSPPPTKLSAPQSLDTFIPKGESLVPIQVANYESLDQVIGQYGVVDLLSTPLTPHEKAKRVAYAVKLIRSPRSPRHFSVLIPADEAHRLAGYDGEFTVVVRNPKSIGTKFVKEKAKSQKRRIVYETESL